MTDVVQTAPFRKFLPTTDDPRFPGYDLDAVACSDLRLEDAFNNAMFAEWNANADVPFRGVTSDGSPDHGLFQLQNESAPVDAMYRAARSLLTQTNSSQREAMRLPMESSCWRRWSNPEIYRNRHGIRLDEIAPNLRDAIFGVVEASLSPYGYQKARNCMYLNDFLGRLVWATRIANEFSYNFTSFGEPSLTEPWGWQMNGHHLVMNCAVVGPQMVLLGGGTERGG